MTGRLELRTYPNAQSLLTFMARKAWFAIYGWAHVCGGITPVYYGDVALIRTK